MRFPFKTCPFILLATALLCCCIAPAQAQSRPFPDGKLNDVYQRLLARIRHIPVFDNHAHPGFPNDPDVDAMAIPPSSVPFRLREDNPELVQAARAMDDYPYSDLTAEHAGWLIEKKKKIEAQPGYAYFDRVLDRLGVETCLANRVAMPDYLDPKRFRWVFFVDSLLFPLDNHGLGSRNPDMAVFMPMQGKVLERLLKEQGLVSLPERFEDYLRFVADVLESNRKKGAVAIKFEAAYFRSLHFGDPPRPAAARIYARYHAHGVPTPVEYQTFQDFVFRFLVRQAGRLHLAVHFHTSVGAGDYFSLRRGDVMNLENVLRDPRYNDTTFVLLHGGYPHDAEAIWLAARKNVYLDSSIMELMMYPQAFKHSLRRWLEIFPDKILYGSDAFPFSQALGVEETFWLGLRSAREALAGALAEMVSSGEISEARALELARGYLHDNAARLYASGTRTEK